MRYKQNLRIDGNRVISYTTHVATIDRASGKLLVHGYWSKTTSKHINHVAAELGLSKVDAPLATKEKPVTDSMFGLVAMVAKMGTVLTNTKAECNDWQASMLKAGLGDRGLTMPDDWDQLDENTKARRLEAAIGVLA